LSVDSGTTTLRVAVEAAAGAPDPFLYLYDCADKPCHLWAASIERLGPKSLLETTPRPAAWQGVLGVPGAGAVGAPFADTETMTHPRYGSGAVTSAAGAKASGAAGKEKPVWSFAGTPPAGYEGVGVVDVVDDAAERAEKERPVVKF